MHLPNDPWEADVPRNVFSDWLKCPWGWWRKCDERLTGGEGEAEWKEAELPRDPGIFTGAELCSKLPPGQRTHREDGYVWPWSMGTVQEFRAEGIKVPFLLPTPLRIPSAPYHVSFPSQPLRGALKLLSHDPRRLRPSRVQRTTLSSAKATEGFLSRVQSLSGWRRWIWYLVKYFVMKNSPLKISASAFNTSKQPVVRRD